MFKYVLHEADLGGVGVAGGQLLPELGALALGAPGAHLVEALAGQGLHRGQYAATAVFRVGVMFFGRLARLWGQALDHVANQKTGSFVEADHREVWVVGASVQLQQGFEALQVLPVDLADAPLTL